MAGITKREREDKARIEDIKSRLADPAMPIYLYARLQGTLSQLQRTQDRRVDARRAALDAARAAATPAPRYNVLPDNHRGPTPEWLERHGKPKPAAAFNTAFLPLPGPGVAPNYGRNALKLPRIADNLGRPVPHSGPHWSAWSAG